MQLQHEIMIKPIIYVTNSDFMIRIAGYKLSIMRKKDRITSFYLTIQIFHLRMDI